MVCVFYNRQKQHISVDTSEFQIKIRHMFK